MNESVPTKSIGEFAGSVFVEWMSGFYRGRLHGGLWLGFTIGPRVVAGVICANTAGNTTEKATGPEDAARPTDRRMEPPLDCRSGQATATEDTEGKAENRPGRCP